MVVFDLDPGEPATITECCQVALDIRDVLWPPRLRALPQDVRAQKGLQLYLPLNAGHARGRVRVRPRRGPAPGEAPPRPGAQPDDQRRCARARVFVDWARTPATRPRSGPTRCGPAPSRRCRRPSPGTGWTTPPVAPPLSFTAPEVLRRVDALGDLFAPPSPLEQGCRTSPAPAPEPVSGTPRPGPHRGPSALGPVGPLVAFRPCRAAACPAASPAASTHAPTAGPPALLPDETDASEHGALRRRPRRRGDRSRRGRPGARRASGPAAAAGAARHRRPADHGTPSAGRFASVGYTIVDLITPGGRRRAAGPGQEIHPTGGGHM